MLVDALFSPRIYLESTVTQEGAAVMVVAYHEVPAELDPNGSKHGITCSGCTKASRNSSVIWWSNCRFMSAIRCDITLIRSISVYLMRVLWRNTRCKIAVIVEEQSARHIMSVYQYNPARPPTSGILWKDYKRPISRSSRF